MEYLLFTLDYELFGNGSGDVFRHIIEPTNQLLTIANRYGVKYTFFFEVIEYWKLKEEWEKGNDMGYRHNPIEAMENQIRDAYRQGHDIQLHLHPQWVDACWEKGGWVVNLDKWRLGGYSGNGVDSLVNLIKRGKQTLEELLRPVDPQYECIAMRAGGYNIQPSEEIVKAMKSSGIFVDSSIYPGGKETGVLSNYDYSSIGPDKDFWRVGTKLEETGDSEIIEVPIVAFPMIRLKKFLTWERVKGILENRQSAKESFEAKTSTIGKQSSIWDKIKFFFQKEWQTWDYCLFSPAQHRYFLKHVAEQDKEVYVLVGHPKSFNMGNGMVYLVKIVHNSCRFITLSTLYKLIMSPKS